jgi:hypothetical protein
MGDDDDAEAGELFDSLGDWATERLEEGGEKDLREIPPEALSGAFRDRRTRRDTTISLMASAPP